MKTQSHGKALRERKVLDIRDIGGEKEELIGDGAAAGVLPQRQ